MKTEYIILILAFIGVYAIINAVKRTLNRLAFFALQKMQNKQDKRIRTIDMD